MGPTQDQYDLQVILEYSPEAIVSFGPIWPASVYFMAGRVVVAFEEAMMPVWKEGRSHFFVCDVCDRQVIVEERKGASWDEVRLIPSNLREDGWLLNKRRGGAWEAQCPECSQFSGYKMGPETLDF